MRRCTFMLFLLTSIWSCDNDEIKPEQKLFGHWEFEFSVIGSTRELSPIGGGDSYDFKADKTYIKKLGSFDWRDKGTYVYKEDLGTLSFTYKTYANQISDTKTLDLKIEQITDKELVFKVDYNDTNLSGEFVEFEFIHYLKK